jgi:hypothetical protein
MLMNAAANAFVEESRSKKSSDFICVVPREDV